MMEEWHKVASVCLCVLPVMGWTGYVSRWAVLTQAGGTRHQGKFLVHHKMVCSGGGEGAVPFPTGGQEQNPEGAALNHLEKQAK